MFLRGCGAYAGNYKPAWDGCVRGAIVILIPGSSYANKVPVISTRHFQGYCARKKIVMNREMAHLLNVGHL